jgi:hypothetical protein
MKLEGLLKGKRPDVLERWRSLIAQTYPPETAQFLEREMDRIANPVGHFIRHGTEVVLGELAGGMDRQVIQECIDPLVRIRAVQDFGPSEALDFVFCLKGVVRQELGGEVERRGMESELVEFESRVDELAKMAFDTYSACREQLYEIRIKEIKNRSAVLLKRMNTLGDEPPLDGGVQGGEA